MRSYHEDSAAAGRQILPDLVRAWALFGICVVNVGVLAWPMASSYNYSPEGLAGDADVAAFFAVNAFFLMKSYSLFSLMFGVGFAYQMASVERRNEAAVFDDASQTAISFAGRYWRRILGLFLFGFLNVALFFIGDILVVYATLGSLLFLFRKSSAKTLITWGIVLYVFQIAFIGLAALGMWAGTTFDPEGMKATAAEMATMDEDAVAAFRDGSLTDAILYRLVEFSEGFFFILSFQGIGALAFFLFGLACVRNGVIADPSAKIWSRARTIMLPIGVLISAAGAWFLSQAQGMIDPTMFFGLTLITLGSPFSSFGYIGLIAKWAEGEGGPIRSFFARGGTSSLTAYLMQNAILSFTFAAYGFGQFAQWPASMAIGYAALVALFTIAFASLWRLYFSRGPLEYILRGITYGGALRLQSTDFV